MAITSVRTTTIQFSGDVSAAMTYEQNSIASPGITDLIDLAIGNNSVSVPAGAIGVTIIPPDDNEEDITLKGATGDTGILLHPTASTSIGLGSETAFYLNVTVAVDAVRLIWN